MKINAFATAAVTFLLLVSCHKDVKNDYQAEHDKMMANFKTEYGITESDKIDDGLYLKFTHQVNLDSSTALYPNGTSDVIVDLLGFLGSQGVFEATNYQDANDNGIYSEQYVYGPKRLDIRSLPLGLGVALLSMQEGESAIVLMDHRLAFGGYTPALYEVDLYRVINNQEWYDSVQFQTYKDSLHFHDTLVVADGKTSFVKVRTTGLTKPVLESGDWVTINLSGYYVEADSVFVSSLPGRNFYPFGQESEPEELVFQLGSQGYPVSDIVVFAIDKMSIGDEWEILAPSEHAFGSTGYTHPTTGAYLVPPDMDVHYRIKFVGVNL